MGNRYLPGSHYRLARYPDFCGWWREKSAYADQYKAISRLERAYNKRDMYGILDCFDPTMVNTVKSAASLMGVNAEAIMGMVPFTSQAFGASGYMDEYDLGTLKLTPISCESDDYDGVVTCKVQVTYKDGTKESMETKLAIVNVDNAWYLSLDQPDMEEQETSEYNADYEVIDPNAYTINNKAKHIDDIRFNEGRALVEYESSNHTDCVALIDDAGQMICSFDSASAPDGRYFHSVRGNTFYYTSGGAFAIVDIAGHELYKQEVAEGEEYKIVGYGDDIYLVMRHRATFSENTYALYAIDSHGNMISSEHSLDEDYGGRSGGHYGRKYEWLGEGIFFNMEDHYTVYTFNTEANVFFIIHSEKTYWRYTMPFSEGRTALSLADREYYYVYLISPSDLASTESYQAWLNSTEPFITVDIYSSDSFASSDIFTHRNDGIFYNANTREYYNTSGKRVCSLKSIMDQYTVTDIGWFSGGYAPLILRGQDGNYYYTIIDYNAQFQYDPVKYTGNGQPDLHKGLTDSVNGPFSNLFFSKGYYSFYTREDIYVISPDGEISNLERNGSGYYGLADDYVYTENGYIRVDAISTSNYIYETENTIKY